jgi:hypothetical protein
MNDENSKSDETQKKEAWFDSYVDSLKNDSVVESARAGVVYNCPCCGYKTLRERGHYQICKVCFWEDDGQDEKDADKVRGGPNGSLSLTQARANFLKFGACEERFMKHVRKPLPEEL